MHAQCRLGIGILAPAPILARNRPDAQAAILEGRKEDGGAGGHGRGAAPAPAR
jgi:hypothetical protein